MRDIVPKKPLPSTNPVTLAPSASLAQKAFLAQAIESILEWSTTVSSFLLSLLHGHPTQSIVRQTELSAPIVTAPKKKVRSPHQHLTKAHLKVKAAALRQKAQEATQSVKTPIGKLALAQSAALIALFIYVNHQHSLPTTQVTQAAPPSSTTSQSHFLPNVGEYTPPKPFIEKLASEGTTAVPLHAWLTPWNIDQLGTDASQYSSFSAFWLDLKPDGVNVAPKADLAILKKFREQKNTSTQKYYLTITADPNISSRTLSDPDVQLANIHKLLQVVQEQNVDGIDIDFEGLGASNRDLFTSYIHNLTSEFHANHKQVAVTVEARLANQPPMDWRSLSVIADQIRIMVYDYHSQQTDQPGPIAPIGWLQEVLKYAETTVDPHKLIVGLGNYGYDWVKPDTDGQSWQGRGVSFDQAMALAKEKQSPIIHLSGIDERGYDIGSIPCFTYRDEKEHTVCFEDKDSLQAKVNLVSQYQTAGVIFWSVNIGNLQSWVGKK